MSSKTKILINVSCTTLSLLPTLALADAKGKALLAESQKAMRAVKTFSGTTTGKMTSGGQVTTGKLTLKYKRPNLYYGVMTGGLGNHIFASNGKTAYMYDPESKKYFKAQASASSFEGVPTPLSMILLAASLSPLTKEEPTYAGAEVVNGKTYQVLTVNGTDWGKLRLYISSDRLISRLEGSDGKVTFEEVWKEYRVNTPITAKTFAYKPPKGATEQSGDSDFEGKLLPTGSKAPEFNLATPEGGRVSLAAVLKEKKAVLINFWFYG
jgi:outer membrane lipoprotein-sorting protein